MNKKKDILFVMNNLNVGGAEKALVSLLQVMDYDKYNVDLLLFRKEGLFLKQVPPQVCILPVPETYKYFDMPFSQMFKENLFNGRWNIIYRRIQYKWVTRKAGTQAEAEQFGWKPISKTLKSIQKRYHVAIGFLEKTPNYFVVDKVNAHLKFGFIHTDYEMLKMNRKLDTYYFSKLNNILVVSQESLQTVERVFPDLRKKFLIFKNIISKKNILHLAAEEIFDFKYKNVIVSVGRLAPVKGYDLSLEAFRILKERNISFTWLILGEGELRSQLEGNIKSYGLEQNVFLLGTLVNPYAYITRADVFLQTSLFEGDGMSITEAKVLGLPMVLTNFETAFSHIKDGMNGIIVEAQPQKVADAVENLLCNKCLREKFAANLHRENFGTESEIKKLYQLMEE
ncbi:glycosyltransferase [Chryseobacterium gotjawalense]|uniref:Glycosyltransferase n=1 Tax=Chryseobacterium gotjawalense TaxID=3042315 RepID=A0ABY8RBU0_9FLAO|nr:glycosyltransferase [Chryseobacterium sp. wdc7]WHF51431.1 glycosyltransferase [Chryseobacterium sp. wdc7]